MNKMIINKYLCQMLMHTYRLYKVIAKGKVVKKHNAISEDHEGR